MQKRIDTEISLLEMKTKLEEYWSSFEVLNLNTWDMEMGAATFHPYCFFTSIQNEPFRCMYLQPSRRHADGKYGISPNRVIRHHQFQVLINPFTDVKDIQESYLKSLEYLGLDLSKNDVRFIENDWESTALGAFGVGWEVWVNGMEVTQFTFFTKMADIPLKNTIVELAYGMERLALVLSNKDNFYDLKWDQNTTYKDLFFEFEYQQTKYYLELQKKNPHHLKTIEDNFLVAMENNLYYPAYELILQYNKELNLLLAGRFISQLERKELLTKMRGMVNSCGLLFKESLTKKFH